MDRQFDLFHASADTAGSLACGIEIASTMSEAIDKARARNISRDDICQRMSFTLGEKVSVAMLNAYTAPSRDTHEINLRRAIAFDAALNGDPLLGLFAAKRCRRVITTEEAAFIELGRIHQEEKNLLERKKAAQLALRVMQRG